MDTETTKVRNRTLRRRQKNELIKDLEADLAIIEVRRSNAITTKQYQAFDNLYEVVYGAYISLVSSEV